MFLFRLRFNNWNSKLCVLFVSVSNQIDIVSKTIWQQQKRQYLHSMRVIKCGLKFNQLLLAWSMLLQLLSKCIFISNEHIFIYLFENYIIRVVSGTKKSSNTLKYVFLSIFDVDIVVLFLPSLFCTRICTYVLVF